MDKVTDPISDVRAVAAELATGNELARAAGARLTAAADALVPLLEFVDKHTIVVGHYNLACEANERLEAENQSLKARVAHEQADAEQYAHYAEEQIAALKARVAEAHAEYEVEIARLKAEHQEEYLRWVALGSDENAKREAAEARVAELEDEVAARGLALGHAHTRVAELEGIMDDARYNDRTRP